MANNSQNESKADEFSYKSSRAYFYSAIAIMAVSFFILIVFTYIESVTAWKKLKKFKRAALIPKMIWVLSAATLAAFTMSVLAWIPTRVQPANEDSDGFMQCRIGVSAIGLWYTTAKSLMYLVLVLRLHTAFHDSQWAYTKRTIGIFMGYVLVVTIGNWYHVIWLIWAFTEWVNGLWICSGGFSWFGLLWTAGNDTILCFSTMFLFLRPLYLVLKETQRVNSDHDKKNTKSSSKFVYIATKYGVLSTVGAGSSFLALVMLGVTGWSPFGLIDAVVSGVSLSLMSKQFDGWYQMLCRCFVKKEHRISNPENRLKHAKTTSAFGNISSGAGSPRASRMKSSTQGSDIVGSSAKETRTSSKGNRANLIRALSNSTDRRSPDPSGLSADDDDDDGAAGAPVSPVPTSQFLSADSIKGHQISSSVVIHGDVDVSLGDDSGMAGSDPTPRQKYDENGDPAKGSSDKFAFETEAADTENN